MAVLSSGRATGFACAALAGSPGPARLLGSFPSACYLELGSGAVVAVLTSDAVQLPIGVTLPWSSDRLDLRTVGSDPAEVLAGSSPGIRIGRLRVRLTAGRDAGLPPCGRPVRIPEWAAGVAGWPDGAGWRQAQAALFDAPEAAVQRLLGRGPGLTPAGDDLLCGALAAVRLFGIADDGLATAVRRRLADHTALTTTSLSRQLLLCAAAGDGLPELANLGSAMCGPDPEPAEQALSELLRIGHSSGAALATGLLAGARRAAAMPVAA